MREKKTEAIMREKEAMLKLNADAAPYFVRLYATFKNEENLFFVLSSGGSLEAKIQRVANTLGL